jgi:glycosyltransferase involved in cell wall biosynthesis
MRVIIDGTQASNRSGTGEYTMQLAKWLPRISSGIELSLAWPEGLPAPEGTLTLPGARGRIRALNYLASSGAWLRQAGLIHYPASIGHAGNLSRAVVTVHDVSSLVNPAWFRRAHALYYRAMISRSARGAALVIADSEATASDLEQRLGLARDRIRVIPLGVDESFRPATPEAVERVRARYGLPDRFLLFVGTLEPRKNLPRVVEAFGQIAPALPHGLVLAGRPGWKCGPLQQAAAASPVAERILMPGFVPREDLPALMTAADGFVWPSLYEGFGLPPLEAMACGTPVLTSNAASLPEVVGDAALMADPEQTDDITDKMRALATDDALRQTLREKGLRRAREFTWQRTAEQTVETYRLAGKRIGLP